MYVKKLNTFFKFSLDININENYDLFSRPVFNINRRRKIGPVTLARTHSIGGLKSQVLTLKFWSKNDGLVMPELYTF